MNTTTKDINVSAIRPIIDRIYFCEGVDGKKFAAKLIEMNGDSLFFQTRSGRIIMNKLSSLRVMTEVA